MLFVTKYAVLFWNLQLLNSEKEDSEICFIFFAYLMTNVE